MLWTGLRNVIEDNILPEEAATGCGGKMKVGLAKGFLGETLGLGTGEESARVKSSSGVEGREEMGVVIALDLVGDAEGELLVLLLGTIADLGRKAG